MKEKFINKTANVGFGLTAAGIILSYSLCAAVCAGLNVWYALFCAAVCAIISVLQKNAVFAPDSFLIVPVIFVVFGTGSEFLPLAVVAGAFLFTLLNKCSNKIKIPECVIAGAALGLAFSATALLTTLYFGIGATGGTVPEILKNYRSLGFHPNWRGVLYGTITLFMMITYPFKFKKLNKYLPKEVASLLIPFVLNLFLNPDSTATAISEPGTLGVLADGFSLLNIFPFLSITSKTDTAMVLCVLKGAFSIGLILYTYKPKTNKDCAPFAAVNITSGLGGSLPVRKYEVKQYSVVSAVTAVIVIGLVPLLFPTLLTRIPLHSLAVVLIVSAWQNVPYDMLDASFKERGILEIIAVIVIFASFVIFDVSMALLICILIAITVRRVRK